MVTSCRAQRAGAAVVTKSVVAGVPFVALAAPPSSAIRARD
jgi:formate dehydrogenase assembly factor FdhD